MNENHDPVTGEFSSGGGGGKAGAGKAPGPLTGMKGGSGATIERASAMADRASAQSHRQIFGHMSSQNRLNTMMNAAIRKHSANRQTNNLINQIKESAHAAGILGSKGIQKQIASLQRGIITGRPR